MVPAAGQALGWLLRLVPLGSTFMSSNPSTSTKRTHSFNDGTSFIWATYSPKLKLRLSIERVV